MITNLILMAPRGSKGAKKEKTTYYKMFVNVRTRMYISL